MHCVRIPAMIVQDALVIILNYAYPLPGVYYCTCHVNEVMHCMHMEIYGGTPL